MIEPETEKTCTSIMAKMGPTIGEVILEKAVNLSKLAARRRTTNYHPTLGIGVDTDKWALAYQEELGELKRLLTPGADQVIAPPDDHKFKTLLAEIIDFRKDCVGTRLLFTTISHRLDELIKRHSI